MQLHRLRARTWGPVDLGVWSVAAVLLVIIAFAGDTGEPDAQRGFDLLGALLLGAALGLLVWRRRFPGAVALSVLGLTGAWHALGYGAGFINAASLVAVYSLGLSGMGLRQLMVLAIGIGGVAAGVSLFAEESPGAQLVVAVGWTIAPFLFGQVVRTRRELVEGLAERALRAERDRDLEVERRLEQERLRIAREMHDVLAHTVSAMSVQAGVALDAFERNPAQTRASLIAMRTSSREAVDEIRAALSLLRSDGPGSVAELAPAPSLAQVDDLLAVARGAGLRVEQRVTGRRRRATSLVELTAFRVIQEALTNTMRHARARQVEVLLDYGASTLTVVVKDDGAGCAPSPAPGLGLRGMAERVASCGGRLAFGPSTAGGFEVRAELPLHETGDGP